MTYREPAPAPRERQTPTDYANRVIDGVRPCPCGRDALRLQSAHHGLTSAYRLECWDCRRQGPWMYSAGRYLEAAIEAWNASAWGER